MKKAILSAALFLLLIFVIPGLAFADVLYPAPGPLEAGTAFRHLAASLSPGSEVSAGGLPEGVSLETEEDEESLQVYLSGTPSVPGEYSCILTVNGSPTVCPLTVTPSRPKVSGGGVVNCFRGDELTLTVSAEFFGSGELDYQWFAAADGSGAGAAISGGAGPSLAPGTDQLGVFYYFCKVTNRWAGLESSADSGVFTVVVEELEAVSIEVETEPEKLRYQLGDELDTRGLSIRVELPNGNSRVISENFTVSPRRLDKAGIQTVEVSFGGKTCSFAVRVDQPEELIEGIGVLTLPKKTRYTVGEVLEAYGLSIRVYTNNGYRDVADGLICDPEIMTKPGEQTITVYYGDKSCTFTVTVVEEVKPVRLMIQQLPLKTSYRLGEELETTGLVLLEIDSADRSRTVEEGYSVSPTRLDTAGQQLITVTYGELSCEFRVRVEAPPAASPRPTPESTPRPTPEQQRETEPTPTAVQNTPSHSGGKLAAVLVIAALLALGILAAYVYIMNRGGFELLMEQIRKPKDKK